MDIFIMRHGQAGMLANTDHERQLTRHGRKQVRAMARRLAADFQRFDYILVSPYLRAQQTWEEVQPQLDSVGTVTTLDELTPSGDAADVAALVEQFEPESRVLIISHLPLVGYLVEAFSPQSGAPIFSTAAVAHLEMDSEFKGSLISLEQSH